MKDVEEVPKSEGTKEEPKHKDEAGPIPVDEQLASAVKLIEKAVRQKETRAIFGKVMRYTQSVRHRMTAPDLQDFLSTHLPQELESAQVLQRYVKQVRPTISQRGEEGVDYWLCSCNKPFIPMIADPDLTA